MKLKADEISSLQDARFCSAEGFTALAFNYIQGDTGRLSAEMIQEISGWLSGTESVLMVGENYSLPEEFAFQGVQTSSESACRQLSASGHAVIWSVESWPESLPGGVQIQIPFTSLTGTEDLSRCWVALGNVEEARLLQQNQVPYGITFTKHFRDEEGMLDFERVHGVLDILDELGLK